MLVKSEDEAQCETGTDQLSVAALLLLLSIDLSADLFFLFEVRLECFECVGELLYGRRFLFQCRSERTDIVVDGASQSIESSQQLHLALDRTHHSVQGSAVRRHQRFLLGHDLGAQGLMARMQGR